MADKPQRASGYAGEQVRLVKATCLYIATKLGDLMDELVIIGGLVPSLLIPPEVRSLGTDPHVGTMDLDVGLALALLDEERYRSATERLRRAGFHPDVNEAGNPTRQRWRVDGPGASSVTVDFLIQPSLPEDRGGRLRNLEPDLAAVITPGLHLAFLDKERVRIQGKTLFGEEADREIWVCGPGAFIVLKALAFDARGENKDAYDLYYLIRNYGQGVPNVSQRLAVLWDQPEVTRALGVLQRDFSAHGAVGPRRVAAFLAGSTDDVIQADVVGFVSELLKRWPVDK